MIDDLDDLDDLEEAQLEPMRQAYLRNDLRNILAAIAVGAQCCNHSPEFAAGFEAALTATAVAVGLERRPRRRTVTVERSKRKALR